jgi:hypothetical protein
MLRKHKSIALRLRESTARISTIRACVLCRSRVYGNQGLEEAVNVCDCYLCPLWPYRPCTNLDSPLPDNVIQFTGQYIKE